MKLFGFDIVRCSKADYQELNTYQTTTIELYNRLVEYGDFIARIIGKYDDNEEVVLQMIFERTETCCKLILLYMANKYSIPITSLSVSTRMSQLRQHASQLQQYILQHLTVQSRMDEHNEDDEYEEEYAEIRDEYEDVNVKYYKARDHLAKVLYSDITVMLSVVQYDFFQIIFGVDIIRDRKKRTKVPKGKPAFEVRIFNEIKSNNGGNQS